MSRSNGSRALVMEEERHTIGCRDTDAHVPQLRDKRIGALEQVVAVTLSNLFHPYTMHLPRHDETIVADAETFAKLLSAGLDMRWLIARIVGNVKTVVGRCGIRAMALRGKGRKTF